MTRIMYCMLLFTALAGSAGAEDAAETTRAWLDQQTAIKKELCGTYAIEWKMLKVLRICTQEVTIAASEHGGQHCYHIVSIEHDAMEKTKMTRTEAFLTPDLRVLSGSTINMSEGKEQSSLRVSLVNDTYQLHAKGIDYGPHAMRDGLHRDLPAEPGLIVMPKLEEFLPLLLDLDAGRKYEFPRFSPRTNRLGTVSFEIGEPKEQPYGESEQAAHPVTYVSMDGRSDSTTTVWVGASGRFIRKQIADDMRGVFMEMVPKVAPASNAPDQAILDAFAQSEKEEIASFTISELLLKAKEAIYHEGRYSAVILQRAHLTGDHTTRVSLDIEDKKFAIALRAPMPGGLFDCRETFDGVTHSLRQIPVNEDGSPTHEMSQSTNLNFEQSTGPRSYFQPLPIALLVGPLELPGDFDFSAKATSCRRGGVPCLEFAMPMLLTEEHNVTVVFHAETLRFLGYIQNGPLGGVAKVISEQESPTFKADHFKIHDR